MTVAEAKNDNKLDLFAVRSLLFLPASNPRAIAKARDAGADIVILDLEDAVKIEDKAAARRAAIEAVAASWPMPVAIRINGRWKQPWAKPVTTAARFCRSARDRRSDRAARTLPRAFHRLRSLT